MDNQNFTGFSSGASRIRQRGAPNGDVEAKLPAARG